MHAPCDRSSKLSIYGMGTDPCAYSHSKCESLCTYALHHPSFSQKVQDVYTWRSMAIPSPWSVTNLTIYSTFPTHAVTFGIGNGVESAKKSLLISFHAQFVYLEAFQGF